MAIRIEDVVKVNIPGQSRAIYLDSDLIWKPEGHDPPTFVNLAKAQSEINRLLGQPLKAKGPDKRKLQHTTIIEDLTQIRNEAILAIIDQNNKKDEKIDFGIDRPRKGPPAGRKGDLLGCWRRLEFNANYNRDQRSVRWRHRWNQP